MNQEVLMIIKLNDLIPLLWTQSGVDVKVIYDYNIYDINDDISDLLDKSVDSIDICRTGLTEIYVCDYE